MTATRGADIRNYIPAFKKGAVVPLACISAGFTTGVSAGGILSAHLASKAVVASKMNAAFLSGTLVSGRIVIAVAHGLSAKPKSVVVCPILTGAQGASAVAITVSVAAASAATTSNFYLIGSQKANGSIKYAAYVQI